MFATLRATGKRADGVSVALFQATDHILDGVRLVTVVTKKMEEKLVVVGQKSPFVGADLRTLNAAGEHGASCCTV